MSRHLALIILGLFLLADGGLARSIAPRGSTTTIGLIIGEKRFEYYTISSRWPVSVEIGGPALLEVITRWPFPRGSTTQQEYVIRVTAEGERPVEHVLTARPSTRALYDGDSQHTPGQPRKIRIPVPAGTHRYSFILINPADGEVTATFVLKGEPGPALLWRFTFSLVNTYDDNIFRYSPEDMDDFVYHQADFRFQMESYDDVITSPSMAISMTRHFSSDLWIRLRARYAHHLHAVNDERNYGSLSLRLRGTVWERSYLELRYAHIPRFLIRPYYDRDLNLSYRDPDAHRACDLSISRYSVTLGMRAFKPTWVALFYQRGVYYYNEYFTEYDTDADQIGVEVSHRFLGSTRGKLQYAFKWARAKGYDEEGETRENSDDSDISYDEDSFLGSISVYLPLPLLPELELGYSLHRRYFTTEKSLAEDPYHAGRMDTMHRLSSAVVVGITRHLSMIGRYVHQRRDVSSKMEELLEEVKKFSRNQFSLGLSLRY